MSKQIHAFTPAQHEGQYVPFLAAFKNDDGTLTLTVRAGGDTTAESSIVLTARQANALGNDLVLETIDEAFVRD